VKSALGHPVGYEIMPGDNAMSLMLPEDYPQRRAGFIDYQLWVTPFQEGERYAAGDYPTQSKGGDGLPAWTKADRKIENTAIAKDESAFCKGIGRICLERWNPGAAATTISSSLLSTKGGCQLLTVIHRHDV